MLLQQEKLMVIKKELQHLYHIAHFYKGTDPDTNTNLTQRARIANTLSEDIIHHAKYIKSLNQKVQDNYNNNRDSILHFLTFYDLHNKEIEEVLQVVKTIQSKLSQFLQDRFNQYLPIPMTTKRYSSKGFLDYLDTYYKKILDEQKIDKTPMIFWGHVSGFTAGQSIEILPNSTDETSPTHYIETAYWNYEIPFLLPIITHELGHIALEKKDSSLSKIQVYLSELIKKEDVSHYKYYDDDFLKELSSDIFAYTLHGYPYLIILCHELLGEDFSNQFYNETLNDISISPIADNNIKLFISLIRIKTLLDFIELYDSEYAYTKLTNNNSNNNSNSQQIVKEINDILNYLILPINDTKKSYDEQIREQLYDLSTSKSDGSKIKSLAELYAVSYPGLTQDYINFHDDIVYIPYLLFKSKYFDETLSKKILHEISSIQGKAEEDNSISKFENIFTKLTEVRNDNLDCSVSKNKFRQLLLSKNENKPYELTLYKTRTDSSQSYFEDVKTEIETLQSNNPAYNTKNSYFTFGFFTALSLTEKKESLTKEDIDTVLNSCIIKKEIPFYQYKYSLIKLWDNIHKDNNYADDGIHMILQLQLKDNNTDTTNEALKKLTQFFENKHYKHKIEIFKALGPKEIMIKCHSSSIEHIHQARQKLLQENSSLFRRSYTILYGDYETIKQQSNTQDIMTIIRKKSTKTIEDIKACCENKIEKFYYTSGVTDIQIHWKNDTSMKIIFNCYDTWVKGKYTTDIQTHIIQTI